VQDGSVDVTELASGMYIFKIEGIARGFKIFK